MARRSPAPSILTALLSAALLPSGPVGAQGPEGERVDGGRLWERVEAARDPGQAYALFLPRDADDGPLPFLVVLDPRGRATDAMERFLPVAAELGWAVAAPWESRSDDDPDVNLRALAATLDDVQDHIQVAPGRLYLAGFSGTARFAWAVSEALGGDLGGLVSVGAGPGVPPATLPSAYPRHLAVFGAAGRRDFNFEEMWAVSAALERRGGAHRVAHFDGGHEWIPEPLARQAVEWLDLVADTAPGGPGRWAPERLGRRLRADVDHATRLRAEGHLLEAEAALRAAERDARGRIDASPARRAREALPADELERARDVRRAQATEYRTWEGALVRVLEERQGAEPDARELADALGLPSMIARAEGARGDEADHVARMLEAAFVRLSFYEPRAALAAGRPLRARALVEVAASIRPLPGGVCGVLAGLGADPSATGCGPAPNPGGG